MDTTEPRRSAPRPALLALAAALLAALVYANALGNGWAYDDEMIVLQHPALVDGSWGDVLTAGWWWRPPAMYRPLTLLTLAMDRELWGNQPALFHATNVVMHAAATALLLLLLLRLRARPAAAFLGAAAFAVHPVHVEAVANVVGRAEVLAAILVFAACLLHLSRRVPAWARAAGVGVLYLMALGAKEIALALPLLLLLLDALDAEPGAMPLRRVVRERWGMAVATALALAAFLALRRAVLGAAVGAVPAPYLEGLSTTERWAAAVATWPEYVRLLLWPARLSAEWGPDLLPVSGWGDARTWLGLALGIAAFALAAAAWRRQRWVSVAILWFAAAVFPISNLPFGAGALVTERSLYLPSAAVAFLAPPLVALLAGVRPQVRRLAALAMAMVLALGAARTWVRTPTWESTDTVFLTMARDAPELWVVQWRLAKLLSAGGREQEALTWYARAQAKTGPHHTAMAVESAELLLRLGRPAEAERALLTQIPRHAEVPHVHAQLARARFDLGRYAEALASARQAQNTKLADEGVRANALYVESLTLDVLGLRAQATAAARAAAASGGAAGRRGTRWLSYARLLRLSGDTAGAAAALDSARALATSPAQRASFTLEPLPGPRSLLLRDWAHPPEAEAPAEPAVAPAPRGL